MLQVRRVAVVLFVFSYTAIAGLANVALAADTEIYLDTASSTGVANILFNLDTSGSMIAPVDENNDGIIDEGERSRIEVLQEAMITLLDIMPNLNVGLMRYNYYGGAMLFPVAALDGFACDIEGDCPEPATGPTGMGSETVIVSEGGDDVEEEAALNVVQDNSTLTFGASLSCRTVNRSFPIRNANDTMEARPWNPSTHQGGATTLPGSSDMDMPRDGGTQQLNGLWFRNVNIPPEASIQRADIRFTIREITQGHTLPVDLDMYTVAPGHIDVSDQDFCSTGSSQRCASAGSSPDYGLAALYAEHRLPTKVDWDIAASDAPPSGEPFVSADITPLIEEVLAHPEWSDSTHKKHGFST